MTEETSGKQNFRFEWHCNQFLADCVIITTIIVTGLDTISY